MHLFYLTFYESYPSIPNHPHIKAFPSNLTQNKRSKAMYNPYEYQYPYSTPSIYARSDNEKTQLFKKLEQTLPAVFSRQEAAKQLGYTISAKTLANLDAKGLGPSQKLYIGGKVAYEKENFLEWLKNRVNI